MGYTFNCDGCGTRYDMFPPFAGEFTEEFLKTTASPLTQAFKPGQKVTLCEDCSEAIFTAGKAIVCRRCGWSHSLPDVPKGLEECPGCESDDFVVTGEASDERA